MKDYLLTCLLSLKRLVSFIGRCQLDIFYILASEQPRHLEVIIEVIRVSSFAGGVHAKRDEEVGFYGADEGLADYGGFGGFAGVLAPFLAV